MSPSSTAVEESLTDAQTEDEARRIMTTTLQHKISTVTFEHDVTDLQTAVTDFGMDSLGCILDEKLDFPSIPG